MWLVQKNISPRVIVPRASGTSVMIVTAEIQKRSPVLQVKHPAAGPCSLSQSVISRYSPASPGGISSRQGGVAEGDVSCAT